MIITRMLLENYGLFAGRNEFDLKPDLGKTKGKGKRPIILFGGKNGAGKTTFLGATRLLLYGKQSIEGKVSQKEYEEILRGYLHRNKNAATCASYAKIGLDFEHVVQGEKQDFYVERSWSLKPSGKIEEFFMVHKNGEPLSEVSPAHWESFIADIVPARLSQLFFFDGEKIKRIAEDLSSNVAIAEAIQSLLGIDHVLSLKTDLKVYRSRLIKGSNPEGYEKELKDLLSQLKQISEDEELIIHQSGELQTAIDGVQITIADLENSIAVKGGGFASARQKNQQKSEQIKESIIGVENQIRQLTDTALPFALCPQITASLMEQISHEEEAQRKVSEQNGVTKIQAHLLKKAKSIDSGDRKVMIKFLKDQTKNFLATMRKSGDKVVPVHQFSGREGHQVAHIVSVQAQEKLSEMQVLMEALEGYHQALHDVVRDLNKAPAEEDISSLVDALKIESKKLGDLQRQWSSLQDDLRRLQNQQAQAEREQEKIEAKIKVGSKETEKLKYLKKLGPALDAYKEQLTKEKISALRSEVTECFNHLMRKSDFVKGIDIDHKTFAVTLLDEHGRSIPREDLSSGEKQIFAIAMLWGLARTSGRALPVVIDTPLGRLDSDHRRNLINNYFPNAGHQVILLSTDTEVDQKLYKQLGPYISKSYHLVYDHKKGSSTAEEGRYFWNE